MTLRQLDGSAPFFVFFCFCFLFFLFCFFDKISTALVIRPKDIFPKRRIEQEFLTIDTVT